MSTALCFFIRC